MGSCQQASVKRLQGIQLRKVLFYRKQLFLESVNEKYTLKMNQHLFYICTMKFSAFKNPMKQLLAEFIYLACQVQFS